MAATFLVAAFLSFATVPLFRWLALRHGFADRARPRQEGPLKPRLGGLALYLAFTLAILATLPLVEGRTVEELKKIISLLLGGTAVVAMGAWDDRRELGAWLQMGVQVAAACLALLGGIIIDAIANPLAAGPSESLLWLPIYASIPFTIVWLVGAMNAMNFIDGLDGLAGGITTIAASILFLRSLDTGQFTIAILPLALAGAALGFLPYNLYPSRVTLGTCGALFCGYTLASLSVIGGTKAATMLLVLAIPILDAAWIILRRLSERRSPFLGDRIHIHYRLKDAGLSEGRIVLLLWALSGVLGTLAIALPSPLIKLYALGGLVIIVGGSLAVLAGRVPQGPSV
ncbi:MAG TPA: MraY family glycosyltransferase [Dehalococcoidia bacterium]|nr:MraY family glycosyltransferase [Dehalococcoidia bacterium]